MFDFTFKSYCPNFFTFRVQKDLTTYIKGKEDEDYFKFVVAVDKNVTEIARKDKEKELD